MRIKAEEIKFKIENNEILKGVCIDVKNKEFVGIIGPNGSGKSTFLKCLYRTLNPSSGIIKFDEINIDELRIKDTAKKVAVVSQHSNYEFDFTVKEIVLMGRSPHKKVMERDTKKDYDIVNDVLQKVNIKDLKDRSFSTLSGGEKQRVVLARALAQETECLILDEPTNHLDIKYQLQLMDIVRELNIEVIAAIHDLNIAAMYCDKILVLKDGKVVKYGCPKEVLTKELIKDVYEVESEITYDKNSDRITIIYKPYIKK